MTDLSLSNTLRDLVRRSGPTARRDRATVQRFATKVGVLYIGRVDVRDDDHLPVRGFSASPTHLDDNYCVGTYDGYDVAIVQRRWRSSDSSKLTTIMIAEARLQASTDLPYVFVQARGHTSTAYDRLHSVHHQIQDIPIGLLSSHSTEFVSRYGIYSAATDFIDVELLFDDTVSHTLAAHCWPLSIEVHQGTVMVYATHQAVSEHLLDTMLKNAVYLARHLDNTQK